MENGFLKYFSFYLVISACAFSVGRILPKSWFQYDFFPFRTLAFECNGKFYERFGVKKWQNRLPDMSRIFPKLVPPKNMAGNYKDRLPTMIVETCIAEFIHSALCVVGLYGLTLWDSHWRFFLTGVYIVLFNLPYIIIQRYNRPRLLKVYYRITGNPQPTAAYTCADSAL